MQQIRVGESDVVVAGGVDRTSDLSIKISPEMRAAVLEITYVS